MSDFASHIRNTLRMEKLFEVRPDIGEHDVAQIVKKTSTHASLARAAVDLESSLLQDRVARLFRERKSRQDLLDSGVMHDADTRASITAGASSSLDRAIRSDAVSKTLRYRLPREELEARGIIKHLRGNAYSFQRAAAEARLQRTLANRVSADQLRAMNILNDHLYLTRRMLEYNRIRLQLQALLKDRQSLTDLKTSGVVQKDSIATSIHNQVPGVLEKLLETRPSPSELQARNIFKQTSTSTDLERKLIGHQLENKLKNRPASDVVATFRPQADVDASLAAASQSLQKSFNSLRLKRSLSNQPQKEELGRLGILTQGPSDGVAANARALDRALRSDRLNILMKEQPTREELIAKNILTQEAAPKNFQAQAKSLEFALTQLRLKGHFEARKTISVLNSIPDHDFVIIQ